MLYYHASKIKGLKTLKPNKEGDKAFVYLSSKRENVLVYLSNAVEKFCKENNFNSNERFIKWGPYGFSSDGLLVVQEYYPDATRETYSGVSACIYAVETSDKLTKSETIRDVYTSESPLNVCYCEYIDDAYSEILKAEKEGKIKIMRYNDASPKMLQWIRETMVKQYNESDSPSYKFFLKSKFDFIK